MKDNIDAHVRFFGTDYTEISQYIDDTKIECIDDTKKELICLKREEILCEFLNLLKEEEITKLEVNGNQNILFKDFNGKTWFQGIVGVVSRRIELNVKEENENKKSLILDVTLEIHSRFDVVDNKIWKPYFLATMLQQGEPETTGNNVAENFKDYFFDFLLVFKYAKFLRDAYEKGYYRTYQRFEKNDDRLKGSIDIARHIKENMGMNNGRIAYSFRKKTVNNYLNHLLTATYYYIKGKYEDLFYSVLDSDDTICRMIKHLSYEIEYPTYGMKELLFKNVLPISHPYYNEYEQLREVCLKILRDEGTSVFGGNESETEGILYYIPDLWEKFLQSYLEDSKDYSIQPQFEIKIFDFSDDKDYKQLTIPDYVFFIDEAKKHPFMILDAKFKPAWADLICNNRWDKYLSEDYNKCIRDMNSINAHATGIICPSNEKIPDGTIFSHNISKYNEKDKFYSFGIYVPPVQSDESNVESYEKWMNRFKENLFKTVDIIKKEISGVKNDIVT